MMDFITSLDFSVLNEIQNLRCGLLDFLMPLISMIGNLGIVSIVIGLILLCFPKTRKAGTALLIALVLFLLVVTLGIKPLINRPRPFEINTDVSLLIPTLSDGSFPSGHTCCVFATAWIIGHYFRKWIIPGFLIASLVAFSRLYLYVHFPTDVLGGILIGILLALAGIFLAEHFHSFYSHHHSKE